MIHDCYGRYYRGPGLVWQRRPGLNHKAAEDIQLGRWGSHLGLWHGSGCFFQKQLFCHLVHQLMDTNRHLAAIPLDSSELLSGTARMPDWCTFFWFMRNLCCINQLNQKGLIIYCHLSIFLALSLSNWAAGGVGAYPSSHQSRGKETLDRPSARYSPTLLPTGKLESPINLMCFWSAGSHWSIHGNRKITG